ncbi:unnamed protein product [Darwinula stevensoni]|uniref:ceramide glucosyltransferase n=1 Tax=Darwinula stevensoni TaxID=69355 RepID=A0A7R9FNX8_9CRUS|nr:unnamed protein product [Darwinula stevensoni]CAG0896925.1 unnamed protein product [Darwinula stevensoni]
MSQDFHFYAAAVLFVIWSGNWIVYHVVSICYGWWKLHREKSPIPPATGSWPGVSILKPLVGTDPNLILNLETFFTMSYPFYEILFCIHEEGDPSIKIVEKLRKKYPHVDSQVFLGGKKVGANPKINNIFPGYQAAKYDLILISDSGIRMKVDTLMDMVQHMTGRVGLVHQLPYVCERKGFPAALEKEFFGTVQARAYLFAEFYGLNCLTGMSFIVKKNILEDLGGLQTFSCYLAEDFFIARAIRSKGYQLTISSQPAWQNTGCPQISAFHERLIRWAQLRFAMTPHMTVLEPVFECMFIGLIGSWAARVLFGFNILFFILLHSLTWLILDWILLSVVNKGGKQMNKFQFLVCWIFRESSSLFVYLRAFSMPSIRWRTGTYRLRWGGKVKEASSNLHFTHPSDRLSNVCNSSVGQSVHLLNCRSMSHTSICPSDT